MNDPVTRRREELKVAEWDVTQWREDFVSLIHALNRVFFPLFSMPVTAHRTYWELAASLFFSDDENGH